MSENKLGFETLQLHAGQQVDPTTKSRAVPIYQTSTYAFENSRHGADLFALKVPGNIYTRIQNPTTDVLERRIAALEGGVGALATSSGMSATLLAVMNIVYGGFNVVAGHCIYGGTFNLFKHTLSRYGISVKFVDMDNHEEVENAIDDKTRLVFAESPNNPHGNLIDIEKICEIAHRHKIPVLFDNTMASPYLCRPIEFGADIVMHSTTKFIGGHGTTMGGVIVDSGNFDWDKSGKFPMMTEPDDSYHGFVYTKDAGNAAYITKARVQLMRDLGACPSPFNSWALLTGIETLSLRMERHIENTRKFVKYLRSCDCIEHINYPELPESPYFELSKKYYPKGAGSIFTVTMKGGREKVSEFCDNLKLFVHLTNIADAKSIITHSASTTHAQLNEEELLKAGILPNMVRLSIGLESIEDIIGDFEQAAEKTYGK